MPPDMAKKTYIEFLLNSVFIVCKELQRQIKHNSIKPVLTLMGPQKLAIDKKKSKQFNNQKIPLK